MEKSRTANLIAIFIAAVLMVVLIVGHIRTNESQIFRMPEDGQLLTASVQGRNGPVEVEVAAGPTAFYRVKILSHEETEGIGTLAVDAIPNTIMETQRLDFDAVSGATITSEAIRSAVASALESGGIDPAAFGYVAPTPAPEKEETPKPAPAPAAAAGGAYVPGTYTAEATGMGTVKVSVTVDENAITEVVLDTAGETPEIGGAATEELTSQVMAAQGPAIDGVSGATLTSNAVSTAVADALAQAAAAPAEDETAGTEPASEPEETAEPEAAAKPEETAEPEAAEPETAAAAAADVPDGAQTLKGSGLGKVGDVDVEVVADENTIYSITVVEYEETPGIGTLAIDQIPAAIVEAQSLQVDAVAGATMTTDAIKEAVAAALVSGGIDASRFEKTVEAAAAPESAGGGAYVPGTYTAEATGMGTVKVSVTVDENAITGVVLDT
ncbi:MAG: FMN-binding protein, partial [Oscillospiraceae bacterium]|nr:FMN-binding protein [Oscillospiraceae bacterium]